MSTTKTNLLWKSFKGLRKLNSINSATELGADNIMNVMLSKEKSGQERSIRSAGWFNEYRTEDEEVIRLFNANLSGYGYTNQLIAFTRGIGHINAYIVEDNREIALWDKIAVFPSASDVTDVCMTQFGDRLVIVVAFGTNNLGFIAYSSTALDGWAQITGTSWYYRVEEIKEQTTEASVTEITRVIPYRSRLAINGRTTYTEDSTETIYGIWFSEAGLPINFNHSYLEDATDTTAFFVETGEPINMIVEYHGLTCFGMNRSYNIYGTSANDITVNPITAKGVKDNAVFVLNGQCAYVDSYSTNIFTMRDNIDNTIGFDNPIGDDIQDYLKDVSTVSINALGRRVRMMKSSGQSLVYDVDIGEWTLETFVPNARCVTFMNKEIFCDGSVDLYQITAERGANSIQTPTESGYYSYYKTNLIWLDSQTSLKSHIYPFAVILEPKTNNDFFIKFTTDRQVSFLGRITRAGFMNIATYSENDSIPGDGSKFVTSDNNTTGGVFFTRACNELLVTVENPPYWRYLTIEIYTTSPSMEFNISGIEAKQTFITDEALDY